MFSVYQNFGCGAERVSTCDTKQEAEIEAAIIRAFEPEFPVSVRPGNYEHYFTIEPPDEMINDLTLEFAA